MPTTILRTAAIVASARARASTAAARSGGRRSGSIVMSLSSTSAGAADAHYESHTSESYESAYFYSPGAYTSHLRDLVRSALCIRAAGGTDGAAGGGTATGGGVDVDGGGGGIRRLRLLDVGGGTGNFTRMVIDGATVPEMEAVVVDPFLGASPSSSSSSDSDSDDGRLRFVRAGAESFAAPSASASGDDDAWWRSGYDMILLKEVVHHISPSDRADVFRGLRSGLTAPPSPTSSSSSSPSPQILIVTRPHVDVDYPLFPAALAAWSRGQPAVEHIESDLRAAGFTDVRHVLHTYPCEIDEGRWCRMVRQRFWSTFADFSDGELEEGCEWIRTEWRQGGRDGDVDDDGKDARRDGFGKAGEEKDGGRVLRFEDRLLFVTASG